MMPLKFYSTDEKCTALMEEVRGNLMSHCPFPLRMRVSLPRLLGFNRITASLYVAAASQPVGHMPDPPKFDVALDEDMQEVVVQGTLDNWWQATQSSKLGSTRKSWSTHMATARGGLLLPLLVAEASI